MTSLGVSNTVDVDIHGGPDAMLWALIK